MGRHQEDWEKLTVTRMSDILGTDLFNLYDCTHIGLESEEKPKTISQERKLRIFQRKENKTCLGKTTESSTCVYEHGNDDLHMFVEDRNIHKYNMYIYNYLYVFLRYRNL